MTAFVQARQASAQTLAYSTNVTKGNLLICGQNNGLPPAGISDTQANVWVKVYTYNIPDAILKSGEAILAVNNKTGKVRVQNTEGLSDSEALHKFGRDALKNFGPEAK